MPQFGTNLSDAVYYSPQRPFVNQANLLSRYAVGTNSVWETTPGATLTEDANGYPTGIVAPVVCNARVDMFAGHPNGTWNVDWVGPTDAVTIDGGTNGSTSCTFTKSSAEQVFLVRIRKDITDLRIWHDDDDPDQTFTDEFLAKIRKYAALRFMNWANVNFAWTPTWATRRTPTSYTQAQISVGGTPTGECAWDFQVQLCNETTSDMWVCVHHLADDAYVTSLAQFIQANLTPGLKVYVEHSNEVWNSAFPANAYSIANGDMGDADPYRRGFIYHCERTAAIGAIFKANMIGRTVINCLGVQAAGAGFFDYADGSIDSGVMAAIDAFSPAPYFGNEVGTTDASRDAIVSGGVDEVFTRLRVSLDDPSGTYTWMDEWKTRADAYSKQLLAYEGGQHLAPRASDHGNTTLVNTLIAANRDERMYGLYLEYLNEWHTRSGGQLFFHFNDVYDPSQYGSWGAEEYEGQGPDDAPKQRAILAFIGGGTPEEPTGPGTTTFFHKVTEYPDAWEPDAVYFRESNGKFELIITDEGGFPIPANRGTVFVDTYLTPGLHEWTKRTGAQYLRVICMSGGAGGGSGRKGAAATNRLGGGGGAGGGLAVVELEASTVPASGYIRVGAGGAGGAAVSANSTNGNSGASGKPSIFCAQDSLDETGADTATIFSSSTSAGGQAGTTTTGLAGTGASSGFPIIPGVTNGGSGGNSSTTNGSAAPDSGFGPGGGGGGGGISSGDVQGTGGAGGATGVSSGSGPISSLAGGSGGAIGAAGGNGVSSLIALDPGSGGGGGGAGGAGGNGGTYGAAGGGGGAGLNDVSNSGKGGDGAGGYVIVITYM